MADIDIVSSEFEYDRLTLGLGMYGIHTDEGYAESLELTGPVKHLQFLSTLELLLLVGKGNGIHLDIGKLETHLLLIVGVHNDRSVLVEEPETRETVPGDKHKKCLRSGGY